MRIMSFLLFSTVLFAASCNNNAPTTKQAPQPQAAPESKLNADGTKKLVQVVADYYDLKDAVFAMKSTQSDAAASKLISSTDSLAAFLKIDSANKALKLYTDSIILETNNLIAVKDTNIDKKQPAFAKISELMFSLLQQSGLKHAGIYRQHCPMAFDGKGAHWLSNDTIIKNPYFPKQMPDCGEVDDSLK